MSNQYLLPEVGYLNETATRQYMVPGSLFEMESAPASVTVTPSVLNITATLYAPIVGVVSPVTVTPSVLNIASALIAATLNNVVEAATQYLIPEVGFINETGVTDLLIPGSNYVNETYFVSTSVTVSPSVLTISANMIASMVILPKQQIEYLLPEVGFINETAARQYLVPGTIYLNDTAPLDVTVSVSVLDISSNAVSVVFPLPVPRIVIHQLNVNFSRSSLVERKFELKSTIGTDES